MNFEILGHKDTRSAANRAKPSTPGRDGGEGHCLAFYMQEKAIILARS